MSTPQMTQDTYLPERLEALRELVQIGRAREGFDPDLLAESEEVLRRASERLRLSAGHTVVAIAGGTGSGKTTLFNALAGATFSEPGITRPTTRDVHACVWGTEDAAPLLDWLGVERRHRHARASALDAGESALSGLVLLDLPDHDSVVASSSAAVDRISRLADMLIWVLDPQKYADAAVHNRYLIPLAGHAGLFTVVLNQIDLLTSEQADDCAEDLRRLLESEGLDDAWLHSVSALTGAGLDGLRGLLAEAVSASHAASERIAADIDLLLGRYAKYAGGPAVAEPSGAAPDGLAADPGGDAGDDDTAGDGDAVKTAADGAGQDARPSKPPWEMTPEELAELRAARNRPPWEDTAPENQRPREPEPEELARHVPEGPAAELAGAFADASGLSAMADGRASALEARGARLIGWPLARVMRRGPGAVRSRRVASGPADESSPAGRGGPGTTAGLAPQSEVDNAITTFADAVGSRMPEPWPASVRTAARSRADEVPPALAEAVRLPAPERSAVPLSWRLIAVWQRALLALAAVSLVWAVVIAIAHGPREPAPFGDLSLIPWLAALAAVTLLLGWLTSFACRNVAFSAADRERHFAEQAMRGRVRTVTRNLVLAPAGREMATYERFRRELSVARGNAGPDGQSAGLPVLGLCGRERIG